jgi:hypothetical protein
MSESAHDPPEPAPAPDAVNDIHRPEFWAEDTANINARLEYFRNMRPDEATLQELQAFAAEMIRIVLHDRRVLRQMALDTALKPRRPYSRRAKPEPDPFDGHEA